MRRWLSDVIACGGGCQDVGPAAPVDGVGGRRRRRRDWVRHSILTSGRKDRIGGSKDPNPDCVKNIPDPDLNLFSSYIWIVSKCICNLEFEIELKFGSI